MSPPRKASPAPMVSTTTVTWWAGTSTRSSEVASTHPSAPVVMHTSLEPHSFAKNLASSAKELDFAFLFPSHCDSSMTEDFDAFSTSAPLTHTRSSSQLPNFASCMATEGGMSRSSIVKTPALLAELRSASTPERGTWDISVVTMEACC